MTQEEIDRIVNRVPGGAANVQDIYPLAPLQEGILFHHLLGGDSDPYLLAVQFSFDSRARLDAYLVALQAVIARHDILRTAVMWEGLPEPVQVVSRKAVLRVEEMTLDPQPVNPARCFFECVNPRRYRIDVQRAPLLRVYVTHDVQNERWLLIQLLHHLAGDHVTLELMQEEVQAHLLGLADRLPEPQPFRNLVAQARLGVSKEEHEEYFRNLLGDVEEPTAPFDLLDVRSDGAHANEARLNIDSALAARLRERARNLGVSVSSVCHVAWAQVLARVSGRQDVVFGTILLGRMQGGAGSDRTMGPFINTLPVRILVGEEGAEASVRRTHRQLAQLLGHEQASLALAQRCSGVPAPTPLFSALMNYRHSAGLARVPTEDAKRAWEGIQWLYGEERSNYPIALSVDDLGEGLGLAAQVEAPIEARRVCEYMHRALGSLVEALENAPDTAVQTLEVLPESERRRVLYEWNDTRAEYANDQCIHELFEEQVRKAPETTAVVFEEESLSYGELNRRANRLAHYLRELGVGPDERVAICLERSFEMIVALLGVLKAGGAYVPLDPSYPEERLRYMLQDSGALALLTQESLSALFAGLTKDLAVTELDEPTRWEAQPATNLERASVGLRPEHLAYVIYTSGSAGTPKGVAIEHRNLANLIHWHWDAFALECGQRSSSVAGFGFDAAAWEIWPTLCVGAVLIMPSAGEARNPERLLAWWEGQHLDVSFLPTPMAELSFLRVLTNARLHTLLIGGDRLRRLPPEPLPFSIVNNYGPTETTVVATSGKLEASAVPSIGKPIANTRIYILDAQQQPVPVGVAGELYIGGAGVARGYLNRAELTAERFLKDPFLADREARMYRTGDLGRWLPDGNIEFLGRNDFQVKIRGFRIELGEIEARLAEHAQVREAVVVARQDTAGDKRLVAYYTCADPNDTALGAEVLRTHLAQKLPEYMVPAAYVRLESLPLTPNGKLDRRALPAPEADAFGVRAYEAPQTETEEVLAAIWAEVLKLDRVGRHDNFFELGGHSLLAVRVIERVQRSGLPMDVGDLFVTPTLADLAALAASQGPKETIVEVPPNRIPKHCQALTPEMLPLVQLSAEEVERIVRAVTGGAANVQDIYPLAPMQEGILFHHLLGQQGDPYLLALMFSFDSRERVDVYLRAMQAVVDRHDILRTAVMWEGLREPVQVVWRKAVLPVEEVNLDPAAGDGAKQMYTRFNPRRSRMDVRQAPMLRIYVAEDQENGRWLMFRLLHHLIGDHSTMEVLQEEIQAHLLGEEDRLPAPQPFRNLVAQARLAVSKEEHEAFFRKLLRDVDEPTAPFGLLDVQRDWTGIDEARMNVDPALARRIRDQARKLRVSAATLFHVAWAQVLALASGREDVVFGTVLFGRMQGGLGADRAIGLFTNMLPVRIQIGSEGAEATVQRTHRQLADLLRHEHASLALAQRCSGVPAPTPLFSAGLNYRHSGAPAPTEETKRAWQGIQWLYGEERSNYPVGLMVDDVGEYFGLTVHVEASIEINRVCEYIHTALESLVEALENAPDRAVRTLQVLTERERQQVLYEWNDTQAEYPNDQCIHELFEQQVARTPGAVALVFEQESLSYDELNRRANRLAHYLRGLGVQPDARVAICVERGFEMVVGLLGVLKAGGAYVPLDPSYPEERLRYMLQDSGALALLTQQHLKGLFADIQEDLAVMELDEPARWQTQPETDPDRASVGLGAEHLAYVIYTSGSTGTPKGVMVEHRGLCNLVVAQMSGFAVMPESRILQFASFSFDACVSEMFMALARGASLYLNMVTKDLVGIIDGNRISHATLPPAVLASLPGEATLDSIAVLIVAGDALSEKLAGQWGQGRRLINAYGPTETTICATMYDCRIGQSGAGAPPIGKPIANTRIYILDAQQQPAPVGVAGELYIGGAGVARGYLNRAELTAERFLKDPFLADREARMYRTGDLGRWLPDGNIEFLGRNDFQVKIRGFRIELGEIEARLAEHAQVREAVVVARQDTAGDKRLVAYYTCADPNDTALGAEVLRTHLAQKLPEYMVPAAYVRLESLPLTPNGKLDRRALPAPEADAFGVRAYEAPQTETEEVLAAIWAEVLKLDRVGRHDNFFDLGGHSLLAVTVIDRMQRSGLQMDVGDLFVAPTLADLAALAASLGPQETIVEVPPNRIPEHCQALTPEMLPLVQLTAEEIERIVSGVTGGAANVQDIYPLVPIQEGILFHHLLGRNTDPYLSALLFSFDSRERVDAYLRAMQAVVDRHDILRTAVMWEGLREPVQVVWRKAVLPVEEVNLDPAAGDGAKQMYTRFNPRRSRMDVRQAPMLRIYIAEDQENGRWLMIQALHHLIEDNTSARMLLEEIQAHLLGEEDRLPAPLAFRNLVAQARLGVSKEEHEAYFLKLLGDVDEPTAPYGLLNVQRDWTGIEEARMNVDPALARRIRDQARKLEVSAATVCHVAWAQVLALASGREDVVFGTVLFGRMQGGRGSDRAVGLFINMLPVRIQIGSEGAEATVRRTHRQLADLLRHEHASLALAQRCSGVPAPTPLFSAGLNYRHSGGAAQVPTEETKRAWQGIQWLFGEERSNYPFGLLVDDVGEDFGLTAHVEASIEARRVCEYMHTALESLVEALENAPDRAVRTLQVLTERERQQVLYEWNDTQAEYPNDQCIHELFEQQVARTPGAVALVFEQESLSYDELNRRANRLAHYLRGLGVQPDARVAICVERGFEMVVGLLGVLKAGGAYVPLDPSYPEERLRYMLQDSGALALLIENHLRGLLAYVPEDLQVVDLSEQARWRDQPDSNPDRGSVRLAPRHLAYVIYTSGSTGTPKGVMVEHRGLCNLVVAQMSGFAVMPESRILQFASFSFDACVWEMFMALARGASLYLNMVTKDLVGIIDGNRISHATLPPAVLASLPEEATLDSIAVLIVAGDALSEKLAGQWGQGRRLINAYGPTETTICATMYDCRIGQSGAGAPPIGKPIANTRIYILDAQQQPVPVGVAGELYIGGAGVARGYLNRAELTAERFLKDPFLADREARMYRTGDLGRWLPDGNIEFLGRNDFQVKIRGFRIELGEIEARLAEHAQVREAVVVARQDTAGDKRLVAYYTCADPNDTALGAEVLRTHLAQKLPEYMVPAAYVRLESLPLTPNGKLDRRALPAPEADAFGVRAYEAPQTETEEVLAAIWAEVLKLDRVGRHDNFFELGGHSLLAVTVIDRMQRSGLQMDVGDLFVAPTLADLAALAASLGPQETIIEVPPNRIPEHCQALTPEMLPLVQLTGEEIERIVSGVTGGAANVQDIYPLVPIQEGILFHHLLGRNADPYLSAFLFGFQSRKQLDAYLRAMQAVMDRHDILRTAVMWEGLREPVQVVWRKAVLPVEEVNLDPAAGDGAKQMYTRFNPGRYRMDVRQAPMLRVFIAEDKENERWLMIQVQHHLIEDNTSARMLLEEIQAHLLEEEDRLPAPLPFRNLVAQARLGASKEEHEAYFLKSLGDVEEPTAPFGLLNVQGDGTGIEEARMNVDPALARRIRDQVRKLEVSAATVFHVAWAQVLARASGREDVVFGTVLFGRMQGGRGSDRAVGLFINMLPVRIQIGSEGAEATVQRTHRQLADLLRHEHASLALAQRCSGVPAPSPLFSALLNYRHGGGAPQPPTEETMRVWHGTQWIHGEERSNYPFGLMVDDVGEDFGLTAHVEASIEARRVCEYMHTALESLVEALENAPDRAVRTLQVLTERERQQVLYEWNDTQAEYPNDQCIHELFEQQVARTPGAVALVFEQESLSYDELNRRANRLAHYLRGLGVQPDARVAICVERGFEMVVGLLGVLKAGGAYVPLDPSYPEERLRYMLQDSGALALLTQQHLKGLFADIQEDLAVMELDEPARWQTQPETDPDRASVGLGAEHLAYVIYTSGSTGTPKGVMGTHRATLNRIAWMYEAFPFGPNEVCCAKSSYSFVDSIWELFGPLLKGISIVVLPPSLNHNLAEFTRVLTSYRVTRLVLVPSLLRALVESDSAGVVSLPQLKYWSTSGEQLPSALAREFLTRVQSARLLNLYGSTEDAGDVTCYEVKSEPDTVSVPIGKPIANTRIYILDAQQQPVPVGVAGELYIGGAGVARGYLNRAELTAERFLKDPFLADREARMYRTGDLGRWLPDGNIEFLGRNDFQVKIRGFRIELGEIEARLAEHAQVREAVVVARQDTAGDKRLVAYYTCADPNDTALGAEVLRTHLAQKLPEYMVPAAYVRLESLPLTPNGKLDRRALPAPEADAFGVRAYEAPQTETEEVLAAIWAEVLKLDRVGRHDNFFELGGHSLLAVRVMTRVQEALSVAVPLSDLFTRPVLADLAHAVETAARAELPPIAVAERGERIPLSFAQQRLWFLAQMEGVSQAYHIPLGVRLHGELDRVALCQALDRIVARHEALRTTFAFVDGEPVQRIVPAEQSRFSLLEHDLRQHFDARGEFDRLIGQESRAAFDLESGPLIRGRLIREAEAEHTLLITMHHIVSDGWSMGVLLQELSALYGAFVGGGQADPLPELRVQYADYAVWQRKWMAGEILRRQAEYWKAALAGAPALLELPTDHARPAQQDYAGALAGLALDEELTAGLKALSKRQGTTLYMTLLAAWAALLARLSGQPEVVIGTPVANRNRIEIENLIGFFVNTLALRLDVSGTPTVSELLARVKQQALTAQQHQDIPFDQVVEITRPVRSLAHSPLFQVMFAWQTAPDGVLEFPGLEVRSLGSAPHVVAKFDLTLSLREAGERIVGGLEYATSLFEHSTIERYLGYFRRLLEGMVAGDSAAVDRLPMLPERERQQVLYEWNDTQAEYPNDQCIHELFEQQVARTPGAVALVFEQESLSYDELNRRANRLAHYLRGLGVQPDARVAICVERGFEMVVGLLGVLKAGGAYVPLDPSYPEERLRYMLQDSGALALLTQQHLKGLFADIQEDLAVMELDEPARWQTQPETDPDRASVGLGAEHLAYVIYTSGSTGTPKGVMVEHANITRLFTATNAWFQFSGNDFWTLFHSYAFDFSVWEIWGALLYGGRLIVVAKDIAQSPDDFYKLICREKVTILNQTPSAFRQLVAAQAKSREVHRLRHVIFGGEALEVATLKPWYEQNYSRHTRLINMYGITETTVHVSYRPLVPTDTERRGSSPIGCHIPDLRVYILDTHGEPVPVGVAGELYIGGAGVARGYLNRAELTAERFLKDPFLADREACMYRTGDLGRWLPDGNIEFLGRNDFQVKIRGFRIELGEIEARLAEHAQVREAVVVARQDTAGDKRLVAYYTCADPNDTALGAEVMRTHLAQKLPEYMVPAAYVRLESLPLTPNGKLDRRALPAPEADAFGVRAYEAPQTETEEVLAAIWAEVLKLDRVGRHDNFFELGGHSLSAVTLVERMWRNGIQVDVRALFATPTVAGLVAAVIPHANRIEVPPNRISDDCEAITPEMLPLVQLTAEEVERIVSGVAGGVANVQDIYPLAPLQEGILFHHLMSGEGDPYLLASLLSFDSRARLEAYLGALQAVVDRHDILRTAVVWEGLSEPLQVVWRKAVLVVQEVELDPETGDASQQLYARFDPRRYRMDVRQAPLLRIYSAYDRVQERWLVMQTLHHLAGDHSTLEVVQEEIQAHLLGEANRLPTPLPFRNLVAQARLGVSRAEHERYFQRLLGDVEEPTAPFGLLDVRGDGTGIQEAWRSVDADLVRRMRERARKLGVSAASICHVAWAQTLACVSGREDVVFGTVLFGRMQGGVGSDRAIGLFVNTLPVRIKIDEGAEAVVRRTHGQLAELLRHEHASLALAQRCSGVPAPTPLFSALLNYRHSGSAAQARTERAWEGIRGLYGEERSNYPITLSVEDLGEELGLTAQVAASVEARRVCEYMHTALESLVEALENAPDRAVRTLQVLTERERQQVLYEWNDTQAEYPNDQCIHELFEQQVARTPGAVALVFEQESLSYDELNRRANRLAHYLRGLGVQPDARVAICVERGFEMVVGLLGVLKAGGAYVPLDPSYPEERLRYMLQDSGALALLTQQHLKGLFADIQEDLAVMELDEPARWQTQPETDPDRASVGLGAEHLAYVIYTSGSTGTPKGVMVEHASLLNTLVSTSRKLRLESGDRTAFVSGQSFDISLWEVLTLLTLGGAVEIWKREQLLDISTLTTSLKRITVLHAVPSLMRQIVSAVRTRDAYTVVRLALTGGDTVSGDLIREMHEGFAGASVRVLYGPTESAILAAVFTCESEAEEPRNPPIGRPIANTRIYILDAQQQPVPVGVAGELYIGGAGVARGYLNRAELTAERFLKDPFLADREARMYRTGDLGRWLPDGNIEFLGRNDFQVKIRGFRIELGEIEARLAEHAQVREAVVVARQDTAGDKRLVAYYTCADPNDTALGAEVLRTHLAQKLPEYMVPAAYVRLESLPLTPNGKLDRRALPAPEADAFGVRAYEAPQTETEEVLAAIWAEVLKLDRVGRHDNFFELGGHSLLAVTVIERTARMGLAMDIGNLFQMPTLSELASTLNLQTTLVEILNNPSPDFAKETDASAPVYLRI